MSKIIKNSTGSAVPVDDVGITVPASEQYTIPEQDYSLWAASSDTVTLVGDNTLVVNDGSVDLSISDGVDLIKGLFPRFVTRTHDSYYPDPSDIPGGVEELKSEVGGALRIRGPVHTDEESFREDFRGISNFVNLTGVVTITNGSDSVTGVGTAFTSELRIGMYIKLVADTEVSYAQIDSIISDEELVLSHDYAGAGGSGTAIKTRWAPSTGTGSITVASSYIVLGSGVDNGNYTAFWKESDYPPYTLDIRMKISQRIANQNTYVGFVDNAGATPSYMAVVLFDGTDNTKIKFITSSSTNVADIQTTIVTLKTITTDIDNTYTIEVGNKQACLLVNGEVVAIHQKHIPDPYVVLYIGASIQNSAIVTNTNLSIDVINFENLNRVSVKNDFSGSPVKSQIMGKTVSTGLYQDLILDDNGNLIVTALTGFGANFNFGDVATAALTQVAVRRTAYVEPSVNAQRSIASASANDTAAGTGARTVTLTYYDQTGAGPFTEVLTLNGTTGVNTVATNICFIERMIVTTVGSTGSNVGIITLYTAINKGGTAIGTIAATNNQTFWAHHYVPLGKTINVTGISCSHNGTVVGSGAAFQLFSQKLPIADSPNIQMSDTVRLYGQSSTFSRVYQSPIKLAGPSRLEMRVTPESTSSLTFRASFDYFEPQ